MLVLACSQPSHHCHCRHHHDTATTKDKKIYVMGAYTGMPWHTLANILIPGWPKQVTLSKFTNSHLQIKFRSSHHFIWRLGEHIRLSCLSFMTICCTCLVCKLTCTKKWAKTNAIVTVTIQIPRKPFHHDHIE